MKHPSRLAIPILLLLLAMSLSACLPTPFPAPDQPDDPQIPGTTPPESELKCSEGLAFSDHPDTSGCLVLVGIGTCRDEHVVVPSTVNGKTVTRVGAGAFSQKAERIPARRAAGGIVDSNADDTPPESESTEFVEIKSIYLPESVTEICEEAFFGCNHLSTIHSFGAQISQIGKDAFYGTAYYNDEGNWQSGALMMGGTLLEVEKDFVGVYTVPSHISRIADSAFAECTQLTGIVFPNTPLSLGSAVFAGCTSLLSVDFPDTVTGYTHRWFERCDALRSVRFGAGVTTLSYHTFYKCPSLTEVDLGTAIQRVEFYAFEECQSLTELTLPDGVEEVGCIICYSSSFEKLTLGAGTKRITYSFPELDTFYYNGTMAEWQSVDTAGITNKSFTDEHGNELTGYIRGSYTVVCTDGEIFEKNLMGDPPPPEDIPSKIEYEEIDPHTYAQLNRSAENYTEIKLHRGDIRETTYATEDGVYYLRTNCGEVEWELYCMLGPEGKTFYLKKDGAWYLCQTNPSFDYYGEVLPHYSLLVPGGERGLYTVVIEEGYMQMHLGFLSDTLAYLDIYRNGQMQLEIYYSDYGTTTLPEFSLSDVVDGVVLDPNGNEITPPVLPE